MADSDIPAEAVEAGGEALSNMPPGRPYSDRDAARVVLAAALPHIRARVLAEVDAALRDDAEYRAWWGVNTLAVEAYVLDIDRRALASYLRDVLGAGGERKEGT